MVYVCHRKFDKIAACGKRLLVRKGERLERIGSFLVKGKEAVCAVSSEDARRHFAKDDDGQGMKRGKLVWRIAYAPRRPNEDDEFRFTPEEIGMLQERYGHFLEGGDVIRFNWAFFDANTIELGMLCSRLEG